ncbi:putative membrane protein involved in D-alanine export [Burkholderiales bacterium JOSHI_001]|nr:putative membrane protein involved in D-alanine export [Burkholderiales bacterium JOSHI_001]
MLFTTSTFILLFLPLTLLGFFAIGRRSPQGAAAWLLAMSLLFYSHWQPRHSLLLLASIAMNFLLGRRISLGGDGARPWTALGVSVNLGLLAWFKYADFVVNNLNHLLGAQMPAPHLDLPIGISFFTFTQIAFLVDAYRHRVNEPNRVHYGLFVTYFPHLVAGPVLHHAQMMPQFAQPSIYRFHSGNFAGGLAIFAIGLFKKVVVADGISPWADAMFNAADAGQAPGNTEAWLGALAYTFQLYFDFSGYSDMAIGLSWMFNVSLPFNFNSPYQARNISDFWRQWHISLSTFLRDYLYIALGGNRQGPFRRYVNLGATMVLGGLWHGASWTFVAWGALHGLYLMLHHGFRAALGPARHAAIGRWRSWGLLSWALTLSAVVVAWVLFRANTFSGALQVLRGMAGLNPPMQHAPLFWNAGLSVAGGALWCAACGAVALLAPNSNAIGQMLLQRCRDHAVARCLVAGAALALVALLLLVNANRGGVSAFIYFNF